MTFKIEDQVAIKYSVLVGVVKGAAIDQTTLEIQYLVEYNDSEGNTQERYFKAGELGAVV